MPTEAVAATIAMANDRPVIFFFIFIKNPPFRKLSVIFILVFCLLLLYNIKDYFVLGFLQSYFVKNTESLI